MNFIFNKVFITVGTTKFDELIKTILTTDVIDALKELKCTTLVIQYGSGVTPDFVTDDFKIESYRYKDTIVNDITNSDLIISHAGAGTCMDVLDKRKPLITVINDNLMDNHQTELAEKLSTDGYSLYCYCSTLAKTLRCLKTFNFKTLCYNYDILCATYIENLIHPNNDHK